MSFGKKEKLSPKYNGLFEILEKVNTITYQLALSSDLASVHIGFHILILQKYQPNPFHVIQHESLQLEDCLSF
ncbi:Uncharacterized protein TCM_028062 [Theobroma cacao]|uniref:Tf2-1-like SH3-like domain-containing protein n=1 Tax=Theobroma cacao TaxID=3641 RepID=A0A061GA31_THECC|nr:Uncharacterized protein TCM_028062 [Theobroma cacao]